MRPVERFPPDHPREWLNRARSNLALARNHVPDVYLEDLCFEAQQSAEKAIKSVLIVRNVQYPYVHDLARLLSLLEESGEPIPEAVRIAEELTPYAVIGRYPGITRPVTVEEYRKAIEIAEAVVQWAEQRLCSPENS